MWVCINCWEVILGEDSKIEHTNARHLLTNSLGDAEPANKENFVKLCRIYGKINPEETHVVLFYIPTHIREAIASGNPQPKYMQAQRQKLIDQPGNMLDKLLEK